MRFHVWRTFFLMHVLYLMPTRCLVAMFIEHFMWPTCKKPNIWTQLTIQLVYCEQILWTCEDLKNAPRAPVLKHALSNESVKWLWMIKYIDIAFTQNMYVSFIYFIFIKGVCKLQKQNVLITAINCSRLFCLLTIQRVVGDSPSKEFSLAAKSNNSRWERT